MPEENKVEDKFEKVLKKHNVTKEEIIKVLEKKGGKAKLLWEKPTEEREGQTKKYKTEAETRAAAAISKQWGHIIEQIEKGRNRPILFSIIMRINTHLKSMSNLYTTAFAGKIQPTLDFNSVQKWQAIVGTYNSIYVDLENFIGKEEVEKIFPKQQVYFENFEGLETVFYRISEQEIQINDYLLRFLSL